MNKITTTMKDKDFCIKNLRLGFVLVVSFKTQRKKKKQKNTQKTGQTKNKKKKYKNTKKKNPKNKGDWPQRVLLKTKLALWNGMLSSTVWVVDTYPYKINKKKNKEFKFFSNKKNHPKKISINNNNTIL